MAKGEGSVYRKGDYEYQIRGGKAYNFNINKQPEKKDAPVTPKAKPKVAKKPPVVMPKRPVTPTPERPAPTFNPLTSTSITEDGKVVPGYKGPLARKYGDVSPLPEPPKGKRFNPLTSTYYKNGGRVRGDGKCRVKTKGTMV